MAKRTTDGGKTAPELTIWTAGLVAIGLVALRILIVSRGDADTAYALLQNLNVTAIVLATLLPFVTIVIVVFWVLALVSLFLQMRKTKPLEQTDEGRQSWFRNFMFSTVMTVLAIALVRNAMSDRDLFVLASIGVVVALLVLLMRSKTKFWNGLASSLLALGWIALVVLGTWQVVAQERPWLPKERLVVPGWDHGVVYVLSSDEVWTKFLDDKTRTVHVLPTDKIKARYSVSE